MAKDLSKIEYTTHYLKNKEIYREYTKRSRERQKYIAQWLPVPEWLNWPIWCRVSITEVIEKHWREFIMGEYMNMTLSNFMKKYKVGRNDCRTHLGFKLDKSNLPFKTAEEHQKDVATQREEFLAKTGKANKLANEQYKYEPVYTHKPIIQLPLTVYATNSNWVPL